MEDIIIKYEGKTETEDGIEMDMIQAEIGCPALNVKVATNGKQGGDSGHGGRTWIQIVEEENFDLIETWTINASDGSQGIDMLVGGDWELESLIKAFRFIADELEKRK